MNYFVTEISESNNGSFATLVTPKTGESAQDEAYMVYHQVLASMWANYKSGNIKYGMCTVTDQFGSSCLSGTVPVDVTEV